MISGVIPPNSKILDLGCGCGWSTLAMAKSFPNSQFYGFDIDQVSIERAKENWLATGSIQNVKFECQDASKLTLSENEKYDACMFFFSLHDMSYPTRALKLAKSLIKETGSVLAIDSAATPKFNPNATEEFYDVAESVLLHLPWSRAADDEHGEQIGTPLRLEKLTEMAKSAGFTSVNTVGDKRLEAASNTNSLQEIESFELYILQ